MPEISSTSETAAKSGLIAGFKVLWVAIKKEPGLFTIATLGAVAVGALTIADSWVLGWATEHALIPAFAGKEPTTGVLVWVAALFIGVALLRTVAIVARRVGAGLMQYRLQATYRNQLSKKYLALPMRWHQQHPTGELLSNVRADVDASWQPIAPLPMAVGTLAMMLIAVVQMFLIDLPLALVGLLAFPLVIIINYWYQQVAAPISDELQLRRAELTESAHESLEGIQVIKTHGREAESLARFQRKNLQMQGLAIREGKIRAIFEPVIETIPGLATVAVIGIGALRIKAGAVGPHEVVSIAYLLSVIAFPIRAIGWLLGEFPGSVAGFSRVSKVLADPDQVFYGDQVAGEIESLKLEKVSFSYLPQQPVLVDVSGDLPIGKFVAIVGATGSGKTTLLNLLARLREPDSGLIALDELPLAELSASSLANTIGLVPQQVFIFNDSVAGNLKLGAEFSPAELWDALEIAAAAEFVAELPNGLDTILGERGTSLSGGQRQRLGLARAILRKPKILLLDDATSAVDPESEGRILANLTKLGKHSDQLVLMVAYRQAMVARADEVWYLKSGNIAAIGQHQELLDTHPDYAALLSGYQVGLDD